ncbi:hypothetical protein SK128_000257 [Halocaridina rubra]|uniref:C-type lectin domain-containing protein n=1 Tax=Halocaridina rubra TaxID=373956 RepID=A0AAN9AE05_HALRR
MLKMWVAQLVLITTTFSVQFFAAARPASEQNMEEAVMNIFNQFRNVSANSGLRYCPPPYHNVLGECFYVHKYIPLLTWEGARSFCKNAGGILAEPQHFGAIFADQYNRGIAKDIFDGNFNSVWVGGHRIGNSSNFQWSSGKPITEEVDETARDIYFNFGLAMDSTSNCIMVVIGREIPIKLHAVSCYSKGHYACQLLLP